VVRHRTHFPHTMASETDQALHAAGDAATADAMTVSGVESDIVATSSSSNVATEKTANKDMPVLTDYWKKSLVTEADRFTYHFAGWLPGGLESFIPDLEFPTIDNTTVICFESHLIVGLSLPPSKFLISILNFLMCELVRAGP
jgi:hypothetical protein